MKPRRRTSGNLPYQGGTLRICHATLAWQTPQPRQSFAEPDKPVALELRELTEWLRDFRRDLARQGCVIAPLIEAEAALVAAQPYLRDFEAAVRLSAEEAEAANRDAMGHEPSERERGERP